MSAARRRRSGFTLIEVLVVVVIMATVSAVVLLSFGILGDDDRPLNDEARRLASLVELAEDEALMQGRDYGLEFMQSGYRFVEYDHLRNLWTEVVGDDLLRPRQLEEGMAFDLFLEDRRVELGTRTASLGEDEDDANDDEDYLPHVLIMSSGDVTPFNLTIVRESDRAEVLLATNEAGELEIGSDGQPPL
jgi:general secretion pathway protein H